MERYEETGSKLYKELRHKCQRTKHHLKVKPPMVVTTTHPKTLFQTLCLDKVGPLPKTDPGNIFILIMQDFLTKYTVAQASSITLVHTVAQAFVEILSVFWNSGCNSHKTGNEFYRRHF